MKKSVLSFLLVLAILTVPLFSASMAAAANDEIESLRKKIKSIDDIDTTMFSSLEGAVLKKYTDVKKGDWYMSVMVKLVGLSALDLSLIHI